MLVREVKGLFVPSLTRTWFGPRSTSRAWLVLPASARAGHARQPWRPIALATLVGLLVALTWLQPNQAWAASFGRGALPYETPLAVIRDSVTGPIAFTMSVVGIVIAGIGLIFGGNLGGFIRQMIMLVLAISIVVGATNLMGGLFSQGAVVGLTGGLKRQHARPPRSHCRATHFGAGPLSPMGRDAQASLTERPRSA